MSLTINPESKLQLAQKIRVMAAVGGTVQITLPQADALHLAHQLEKAQRLTILRVPAEPSWMFRAGLTIALCAEVMRVSVLLATPLLGLLQ